MAVTNEKNVQTPVETVNHSQMYFNHKSLICLKRQKQPLVSQNILLSSLDKVRVLSGETLYCAVSTRGTCMKVYWKQIETSHITSREPGSVPYVHEEHGVNTMRLS